MNINGRIGYRVLLLAVTGALAGCEDTVDGHSAFAALERAAETACDCPAYADYPSRGSCLNDIARHADDAHAMACVDRQLAVYGQSARAAMRCEKDAINAYTACMRAVSACSENLLERCEDRYEDEVEACPEYPGGFWADVAACR